MFQGTKFLLVASGLVLTVFAAGFFGRAGAPEAAPCPVALRERPAEPRFAAEEERVAWTVVGKPAPANGLLALTRGPEYRRAADVSLKVEDCTKAEDALEAKLEKIKGEILDMVMEGTEGSRTCTLSALIPSDQFRAFIGELRQMGKVQSEKITASKLKPGGRGESESRDAADPRELSLVSIRMADEKVAQAVLESRGLLASSFERGASHFMNGMAVLVEAFGYLLPYLLVLASLAVPVVVLARVRRARLERRPA